MFIKIEYQCRNTDEDKIMEGHVLEQFVAKRDGGFTELTKTWGYVLELAGYDIKTGMRELFFRKVVSA